MDSIAGFIPADLPQLLTILAAFIGQIAHVVKKRVEEGKNGGSEFDIFKRWVLDKFFTGTLPAFAVGAGVALGLYAPETGLAHNLIVGFVTGFGADSAINRPGEAT